ncbi:WASH complex subunit 3-like [Arachis ipaensis]|uniref:WASH complex subunit 3-like n=1 Tax=Arachis ipaensis TaxID=130454 RepID=UPI000A2B8112|nr:WASH complex subunit 3-like [Arachis ipaensis]XP_025647529.1 WASH complex subunit 3-like [Arachis hypogaea]
MAPRVKGKGVKGHRGSHTTVAASISTTSTSFGTSVVPYFQSGPLNQQPYLMVPNPGYTSLPPPSWPTSGCMSPPPPPPPPILIPPPSHNFSLLVDLETPGSSSASPPSETASVPNSVTKERLVSYGKIRYTLDSFGKTQKKLEKLERAIGKAKKEKLKQKRWNEAYVSYYEKVRASSSSSAVPLPPPPPPPSISSDEDYDDEEDEDHTEDYS